jgi:hypothetical protein
VSKLQPIFDRLDKLSRQRALTENESLMLERAIEGLAAEVKPRGVTNQFTWSEDETNRFCDLIADGMTPRKAGIAIGKSGSAGIGKFDRMRKAMGAQAV